jgi:hypothetical protein
MGKSDCGGTGIHDFFEGSFDFMGILLLLIPV